MADGVRGPGGAHVGVTAAERLAGLLGRTLPGEALSAEELQATLVDDPDGDVLFDPEGLGALGVAQRGDTGFVTVVAVEPDAHRRGVGSRLLDGAHRWFTEHGVRSVRTGASAPRYLWPGVDIDAHPAAVALFESAGYVVVGEERNHRCAVTFRAPVPDGVAVRRVRPGGSDETAVLALAAASYPWWADEVGRAVPHGCCHAAFAASSAAAPAIGFACHSVNRAGWVGPMATDPVWQGRGVGSALLGAVCRDLELVEFAHAEIAWVGPDAFYERAAGSVPSRRFVVLARTLP